MPGWDDLENLQGTGRRFPAHVPGRIPSTAPQELAAT